MALVGNCVVALKYSGGVLMGVDRVLNYGHTHRHDAAMRLSAVIPHAVVGFTGDEAVFRAAEEDLQAMVREHRALYGRVGEEGPAELAPSDVHGFLANRNYEARNDMDPEECSYVVAGFDKMSGAPYVGSTDIYGTVLRGDFFATEFGKYILLPILRDQWRPGMTLEQASELLATCMSVMARKDCKFGRDYVAARVDAAGCQVSEPLPIRVEWDVAEYRDRAME